ncbi:MAG: hypothetical protein ACE147_12080 [Candidatus Methylomirabilales bacterium]
MGQRRPGTIRCDHQPFPLGACWVGVALLVVAWDYLNSGPAVGAPALFLVPVMLAAWLSGVRWGAALAIGMPLAHYGMAVTWGPTPGLAVGMDTLARVLVLTVLAALVGRTAQQASAARALHGLLPICTFCKRIRGRDSAWHALERYIMRHSEAVFSHTFCPECAQRHYSQELPAVAPPPEAALAMPPAAPLSPVTISEAA